MLNTNFVSDATIRVALDMPRCARMTTSFLTATGSTYTVSRGEVSGGRIHVPIDYTHIETIPFPYLDAMGFKLLFTDKRQQILLTSPIVEVLIRLQ